MSNRLSRQRGGGRSKAGGADSDGADRVSLASIKSGSRKLNSQGARRDIYSTRKSQCEMEEILGGDAEVAESTKISKSDTKSG